MKEQKTVTSAIKAGFKGIKVLSMIKAIEHSTVFPHLRLVQQDEFSRVKNRYNKLGYLTKEYYTYLFHLYYNFVLNDFRYEDETKKLIVPTKVKVVEHIGLQILNKLNN